MNLTQDRSTIVNGHRVQWRNMASPMYWLFTQELADWDAMAPDVIVSLACTNQFRDLQLGMRWFRVAGFPDGSFSMLPMNTH